MANIFKQNLDVKQTPNRCNFDMSFQNHLTLKMGELVPVFCKPVVPEDAFRIKCAFGLKFMPLVFPVQTKMRAHMHFFYVRNKNLFDRWQDWISGLKTASDGVVPPYIATTNKDFFKTGSLSDYLGLPTTIASSMPRTHEYHAYSRMIKSGTTASPYQHYAIAFSLSSDGKEFVNFGDDVYGYCLLFDEALKGNFPSSFKKQSDFKLNGLPDGFNTRLADYYVGFCLGLNIASSDSGYTTAKCTPIPIELHIQGGEVAGLVVDGVEKSASDGAIREALMPYFESGDVFMFARFTSPFTTPDTLVKNAVFLSPYTVGLQYVDEGVTDYPDADINYYADNHISALPFRAYESIYNVYYRNSHGVDPFKINGSVEYNKYNTTTAGGADTTPYELMTRNYELDFLTSALPSPQAGVAPLVGVSALGKITVEDENGITTAQAELDDNGNITNVVVTSPAASVDHARTLMNIGALGMNINDFRNTNALQRHLEQTLRSGYRYIDFIAGHFGKSPEYRELDMPEFIGGFSRDVVVSQILQNTDTEPIMEALGSAGSGSPLGSFAGNANAFGGSEHEISHYCDDYGFIMGILCVTPTPAYSQLLPKHFLYRDRLDYYFPEFSQLGMQPITLEEVAPLQVEVARKNGDDVSLTDTFGYQRPNYDLVASVDEVHGNFRTDLRDFLINRRFDSVPELSPEFIKIHPEETNDVFANRTPSDDTIIGQILFEVFAKRPIPRVVIPSLGR